MPINMKRSLICGISGQDGAYLAQLLLSRGYQVFGTSRDAVNTKFEGLSRLGILSQIQLISMEPTEIQSVHRALMTSNPDEIYNLSGQSSVGLSFERPQETMVSIVDATKNLLDAIQLVKPNARFFNAGSGECFGGTPPNQPADENTSFNPQSPYAVAKVQAYQLVKGARENQGLFACTGILFNHESPLRPTKFVTQKIIQAAIKIADDVKEGRPSERLHLGNLAIRRDWGWAPEYVEAMWLMLQQPQAEDFVIATGQTYSLQEFVQMAFSQVGLDWQDYVVVDQSLFRVNEAMVIEVDPSKARRVLGWVAQKNMSELISLIIASECSQNVH